MRLSDQNQLQNFNRYGSDQNNFNNRGQGRKNRNRNNLMNGKLIKGMNYFGICATRNSGGVENRINQGVLNGQNQGEVNTNFPVNYANPDYITNDDV
jgi:hypothetical protein